MGGVWRGVVKNGSQMGVFRAFYFFGPALLNTMSMREYAVGVILMSMNSIVAGYS